MTEPISAWPRPLVDTAWLEARLGHPGLRILDATVHLHPTPESDYRQESGRADFENGHIPGAVFADLIDELSDKATGLRGMMPDADRFAAAMARLGVGEGSFAVLYARGTNAFAARLWWMLRAVGFDDAAVLNGGWTKWEAEGRPVTREKTIWPPARLVARPRLGLFADKDAVRSALDDPEVVIVNALSEEQHRGTGGLSYGRAGRVPGSVNVPAQMLRDPVTAEIIDTTALGEAFDRAGVEADKAVIAYCGGGVAVCLDALALTMLGFDRVAVYDGSMHEWAKDPSLPVETG